MTTATENQVIALAGLYQCIEQVQQLAWQGKIIDYPAYEICLKSLLKTDVDSYADVYEGSYNLIPGLRSLKATYNKQDDKQSMDRMRYAVTLLYLEKKLSKLPVMMEKIDQGLIEVQNQLQHFELTHSNVINKFADIYLETISKIAPRIIVHGDESFLVNQDTASRIRALLLAGIRAAWLWRQAGGSRWQLFLGKKKILATVDKLLLA